MATCDGLQRLGMSLPSRLPACLSGLQLPVAQHARWHMPAALQSHSMLAALREYATPAATTKSRDREAASVCCYPKRVCNRCSCAAQVVVGQAMTAQLWHASLVACLKAG
eukprot:GHRQ01017456.1.p2 GENE.GHRQ01017456.1~~GHRQ01017456.1.p2  ORF type:complete len:110 (-),score=10.62 GHRQ01017456.1:339-668(-)